MSTENKATSPLEEDGYRFIHSEDEVNHDNQFIEVKEEEVVCNELKKSFGPSGNRKKNKESQYVAAKRVYLQEIFIRKVLPQT